MLVGGNEAGMKGVNMEEGLYESTQIQIGLIGEIVKDLHLVEFIEAIDKADTLGPILDPTLWIKGSGRMRKIKDAAYSLLEFQKLSQKI